MHLNRQINKKHLGCTRKTLSRYLFALSFTFLLFPFDGRALGFSKSNHYYVSGKDSCVFPNYPSAFDLGDGIANGEPISRQFESLLHGAEFDPKKDVIEPLHLAYAFYVVAERVGDKPSKTKLGSTLYSSRFKG